MAQMIDAITVTRTKIYRGAGRVLIKDVDYNFPGYFEDIMLPGTPKSGTAYELASGWVDVGVTTEDGVTISRSASLSDGIPVDQRNVNLDAGEPENWEMGCELALVETSLDQFNRFWEAGISTAIPGTGTTWAQHSVALDAPATITERRLAIVQEDPKSGKIRAFAFRKAKASVDGSEVVVKSDEASNLPVKFNLLLDTAISEGAGQFGKIFEID